MPEIEQLTPAKVVEVMRSERFVMLSTVSDTGSIESAPMTPQEVTDDADTYFLISTSGDVAEHLRRNPQVNLAFAETGSWLSVSGSAEFIDDPAKVDEYWNDEIAAYFPGGKTDPDLGLLKVTGDSAQYWGIPGNRAVAAAKMVVAKLKGEKAPGLSGTTEL